MSDLYRELIEGVTELTRKWTGCGHTARACCQQCFDEQKAQLEETAKRFWACGEVAEKDACELRICRSMVLARWQDAHPSETSHRQAYCPNLNELLEWLLSEMDCLEEELIQSALVSRRKLS